MDFKKIVGGLSKSGALNGFLGGAVGGGVSSALMSKKGRKVGKKAIKVGALAAVGGLAYKAYQQYSQQNSAASSQSTLPNNKLNSVSAPSTSAGYDFPPNHLQQQDFEHVVEDNNEEGQLLIMRAMITAAHADGHIDDLERQRIFERVNDLELSVEEKATLFDELRNPISVEQLIAQVPDSQTGIEVYAASASAIDLGDHQSKVFLSNLASHLCIPNELVESIHQQLVIQ